MFWLGASLIKTSLFLIPTMEVGYRIPFIVSPYVKQVSSSECEPIGVTLWNPKTATWIVESGVSIKSVKVFIGHKSYHSIDNGKHLDSYNYAGASFYREFP